MEKLLLAGMNVARFNFSYGDFSGHQEVIANLLRTGFDAQGERTLTTVTCATVTC